MTRTACRNDPRYVGAGGQAFLDFGTGRHKAGLNSGDCFSYALAKAAGEPLLFKGADFSQTDIKAA
jgi:ribonuclease VapC